MNSPEDKKKILYIITQSSPWGGAQRYVHDLAVNLHAQGWDITVATGVPNVGAIHELPLLEKLHESGIRTTTLKHLTRAVNPLNNIRALFEIRDLCCQLKPNIVHLNSSMAGVVGALGARLAGVKKIVYTIHGLVTKEPLPLSIKFIYWLAEWIAGRFRNLTICVSEDDRRAVIRQYIAPPEHTVTIPIGIDPDIPFLSREEARNILSKKISASGRVQEAKPASPTSLGGRDVPRESAIWIGTIAGLYATKGLPNLIEAAKIILERGLTAAKPSTGRSSMDHAEAGSDSRGGAPRHAGGGDACSAVWQSEQPVEFHSKKNEWLSPVFLLIGEGPERLHLEMLIKKYGLHSSVFLLGVIPDAAHYLKAFDYFVLPSVKEGMPYTILEALTADIPIVATRVGGITEICNGFKDLRSQSVEAAYHIVPPGNAPALASAIEAVITQERGRIPLSPMVSKNFSLSHMAESTIIEYLRVRPHAP